MIDIDALLAGKPMTPEYAAYMALVINHAPSAPGTSLCAVPGSPRLRRRPGRWVVYRYDAGRRSAALFDAETSAECQAWIAAHRPARRYES